MKDEKISSIKIWTRGKNRDEFGNPYVAFIAWIQLRYISYARKVSVMSDMQSYDSGKSKCLEFALLAINRALDLDIRANDTRIEHHHKHVYRDADLEHPEKWKIDLED